MARSVVVRQMGQRDYLPMLAFQRELQRARADGAAPDTLILTEHEAVFTLGRRHPEPDLRAPLAAVEATGIAIIQTERGGDITYHGPGQLVAYGIIHLGDWGIGVVDYVVGLEEAAIRMLAEYGIEARRMTKARGAWVGDRKIASVGVNVRQRVAMHGIAINLDPNLAHFRLINPCGLDGVEMTSVAAETGGIVTPAEAGERFSRHFASVFECDLLPATGV